MRDRFFAEYTSRFRNVSPDAVDPYKLALYKLIGRIDVRKRFPASLVRNSENWLWLQLSLVREHAANAGSDALADDNGIFGRDSYTLQDVANTVLSFGEAHFDPKGHRRTTTARFFSSSGNSRGRSRSSTRGRRARPMRCRSPSR